MTACYKSRVLIVNFMSLLLPPHRKWWKVMFLWETEIRNYIQVILV